MGAGEGLGPAGEGELVLGVELGVAEDGVEAAGVGTGTGESEPQTQPQAPEGIFWHVASLGATH